MLSYIVICNLIMF